MPPFMDLAETVGNMIAQVVVAQTPTVGQHAITSMTLKTCGAREVNITTKKARQLLEASVLKGMLKPYLQYLIRSPSPFIDTEALGQLSPDLISSPSIAKDLSIECIISPEVPAKYLSNGDGSAVYWNLLSVDVGMADGSTTSITGTVFGSTPHIVRVDNEDITMKPEGNYLLTFQNEDRPGAISEVLGVMSREGVNVASMNLTRDPTGESLARCFISLDDEPSDRAMETLRARGTLHNVAKIQLR